jgi:hypothetical protein
MHTIKQAVTDKSKLTQVAGNITGKLWCGYHQGFADATAGSHLWRNGKRWMCVNCLKLRGITPT